MNKLDISGPSTTILTNVPGYHTTDQYLTQIGTFTIWCDTTLGQINIILPSVSVFTLASGNFKIFDAGGNAGNGNPIVISFADGAKVNGADSITLNTNYGNAQVQLQDGQWFANLNGTGGGGGLTGANNGLSVSGGTVVQLGSVAGAPLIQNSIVTGLETYRLSFQSTDGTFLLGAGNLSGAPYNAEVNSFATQTSTALQVLSLAVLQNNLIILKNTDLVSTATRYIAIYSTSAASPGFPTGGLSLVNQTTDNYASSMDLKDQIAEFQINNLALSPGSQFVSRLVATNTTVSSWVYQNNTVGASPINGFTIQETLSALYYGSTRGVLFGELNTGNVFQLDTNGISLIVSSVLQFNVSPSGIITTLLPSSNAGLTTGMLYRASASPNAAVMVV